MPSLLRRTPRRLVPLAALTVLAAGLVTTTTIASAASAKTAAVPGNSYTSVYGHHAVVYEYMVDVTPNDYMRG